MSCSSDAMSVYMCESNKEFTLNTSSSEFKKLSELLTEQLLH